MTVGGPSCRFEITKSPHKLQSGMLVLMQPMEPHMKTGLTLLAALATAGLLHPGPLLAQDADDIVHGREIARTICAACHVVARGQLVSPNSEAPPFPVLAATPGMTTIALTAALLTSHRQMPNIILQPDERQDVIAYILTLK
jgi:mono/diheme cytochrome c family protein